MNANARWQEVISDNMAAANIPGFKKQEISFEAVRAGMLTPNKSMVGQPVQLPASRTHLNFTAGEIRRTDGNADLAIEGNGFFEVQLSNGSTAYTRDGEFKINSLGQLVTKQGFAVMGEAGPIQLDRNTSVPITVASDGTISQGGEIRGKLKITTFNDPKLLTVAGGFFVAKNPALQPEDSDNSFIRQGFLEGSNASPVTEMAGLVTTMRAYEVNQRVVQMQDERMGRVISELGSPN